MNHEDAASCKIMTLIVLCRCPIIDSHTQPIVSLMYQASGAKLTSSSRTLPSPAWLIEINVLLNKAAYFGASTLADGLIVVNKNLCLLLTD